MLSQSDKVNATYEKCKTFPTKSEHDDEKSCRKDSSLWSLHDKLKVESPARLAKETQVCNGDLCVPKGSLKSCNIAAGVFETYLVDPIANFCTLEDNYDRNFFDTRYRGSGVTEVFTVDTWAKESGLPDSRNPGEYNVAIRYPRNPLSDVVGGQFTPDFRNARPPVLVGTTTYGANPQFPGNTPVPFSIKYNASTTFTIEFTLGAGGSLVNWSGPNAITIPSGGIPLPPGITPAQAQPLTRGRVNKVYVRFFSAGDFSFSPTSNAVLDNIVVTSNAALNPLIVPDFEPTRGDEQYWVISNFGQNWEITGEITYPDDGVDEYDELTCRFYCVNDPSLECDPVLQPTLETVSLRRTYGTGKALVPSVVAQPEVTSVWGPAFALQNYPTTESARVFTVPVEIEFEKEFPDVPTVVCRIYSAGEQISLDLNGLRAMLVSSTVIVDKVTSKGFLCRIHASIVGNTDAAVQLLFKALISGNTLNVLGDIDLQSLKNTVDFIKLAYHAHA